MVLSDAIQLEFAMTVFGDAYEMPAGWTKAAVIYLKAAGIKSIGDMITSLDSEFPWSRNKDHFSTKTIECLSCFLPGLVGFRCFEFAQLIAEKVEKGFATTKYAHRSENGTKGDEEWQVSTRNVWIVNVDCAGFVRNTITHVSKKACKMALSDRDFMRAKDFYDFFSTIRLTVMDLQPIEAQGQIDWRIVDDLRMVIPGDIIVYRPKGGAAGGSTFTTNDRKDLYHCLKAVKTAQIWYEVRSSGSLVSRNVANDSKVEEWATNVNYKLQIIGICDIRDLYWSLRDINWKLHENGFPVLREETLKLLKECCETTAINTGHIVFVSGPAVYMGNDDYHIRVVHSTKYGKKDKKSGQVNSGVQEFFHSFSLREKAGRVSFCTRKMIRTEDETLFHDELSGQANIEVLAARICF